jgi:hypothetical protein
MPSIVRGRLFVGVALVALAAILFVFVRDAQTPPAPVALPLTNSFDGSPTGFTLRYPDGWSYSIPQIGVFVIAPDQTLSGSEPGPTLTVQRAEPISIAGTLDSALDRYLRNGPLRTGSAWKLTSGIQTTQFLERDARSVELEGTDSPNAPRMHARITVATAKNTIIYFLVTSVPVEKLAAYTPTLDAMLATVQILE